MVMGLLGRSWPRLIMRLAGADGAERAGRGAFFLQERSTAGLVADEGRCSHIRNVGIMAHIDAGKTTTTERILFYSGLTRKMGNVDDGNTVMDYLQQERDRGITISSATVSLQWNNHRINLIDTPGHVDFTFEVERSLKVLDGAVALFDASAGVEAQSIAVWRQASKFNVPRIAFVNKMDKPKASLHATVESMRRRLKATPLVTQLPIGSGRSFRGILDLVTMEIVTWEPGSDGASLTRQPLVEGDLSRLFDIKQEKPESLPISAELLEEALEARSNLTEQVVTMDAELLEQVLDDSFHPLTLPSSLLRAGLRRLTLQCSAVPVFCGSALRNVGVQPLMEAVVSYLPSPREAGVKVPKSLRGLYAYAFKVVHDRQRGSLVYLRIYSGSLNQQTTVYNASRNIEERITRLLLMLADEQQEVSRMGEGNIVVAVGLKNTFTGDSIVQSAAVVRELEGGGALRLSPLQAPPPMFFCTVEPASAALQKDLEQALACLAREDPSLRVAMDTDTGQMVLSGMGQLHLEIVHGRLTKDFGVACSLGQLRVAYRETPVKTVTQEVSLERMLAGKKNTVEICVKVGQVEGEGEEEGEGVKQPEIILRPQRGWEGRMKELIEAVRVGVESVCLHGPLLGYPVQGVRVEVTRLNLSEDASLALLTACMSEAVSKALASAEMKLLEPYTELEVVTPEEHLVAVLADLSSQRRGRVTEVENCPEGKSISALVPLAALTDYSTILRTMTSGTASFSSSSFSHYEAVSPALQKTIIEQIRGFLY